MQLAGFYKVSAEEKNFNKEIEIILTIMWISHIVFLFKQHTLLQEYCETTAQVTEAEHLNVIASINIYGVALLFGFISP